MKTTLSRPIQKEVLFLLGRILLLAIPCAGDFASAQQIEQLPSIEKRRAIVIGVSRFRDGKDLQFAVEDAKELADLLAKLQLVPESNIVLLTSDEPDVNLRPTKAQILDHLRRVGKTMPEGGLLIFAFSGHGFEAPCHDDPRPACYEEFLAPADALTSSKRETSLSSTELAAAIRSTQARGVITFLDICSDEDFTPSPPSFADHHTLAFDLDSEHLAAFATFDATSPNESAFEDNARQHSYFSGVLLDGLAHSNEARNSRGEVTLSSLARFLSSTVTRRAESRRRSQHPKTQIRGFDADRVVLVPAPAEPCPNNASLNPRDGLCYSWIPEGSIYIGCSRECGPLDLQRKLFTLKPGFFLTQTEVNVGAYRKYTENYHHSMPDSSYVNPDWEDSEKPIVNLKWEEASSYCHEIGGRLPTEDEWEYAARAGTSDPGYYWGDSANGNFANFGRAPGTAALTRGRTFLPNRFGLYDMLGNAAEWTDSGDEYGHIVRGGSWRDAAPQLRLFSRRKRNRLFAGPEVGFRCLLAPSPAPSLPSFPEFQSRLTRWQEP